MPTAPHDVRRAYRCRFPDCPSTGFQDAALRDLHEEHQHGEEPDEIGLDLRELTIQGMSRPSDLAAFLAKVMQYVLDGKIDERRAFAIARLAKETLKIYELGWEIQKRSEK